MLCRDRLAAQGISDARRQTGRAEEPVGRGNTTFLRKYITLSAILRRSVSPSQNAVAGEMLTSTLLVAALVGAQAVLGAPNLAARFENVRLFGRQSDTNGTNGTSINGTQTNGTTPATNSTTPSTNTTISDNGE